MSKISLVLEKFGGGRGQSSLNTAVLTLLSCSHGGAIHD